MRRWPRLGCSAVRVALALSLAAAALLMPSDAAAQGVFGPTLTGCVSTGARPAYGCPATIPQISNGPIKGTDNAWSVFVGGNLTIASGAEAEGRVFVYGDFTLSTGGIYNLGVAGVGSRIIPEDGLDFLLVGGDVAISGAGNLIVGGSTGAFDYPIAIGKVRMGGARTGTGTISDADSVVTGASIGLASYDATFSELASTSTAMAALPASSNGVVEFNGYEVNFRSTDGASGTYVFNVARDIDDNAGGNTGINFQNFPSDAIIIINMTGAARAVRTYGMVDPGGGTGFGFDPSLRTRIVWNFPTATTVTLAGPAQFEGSVLVSSRASTTVFSMPGHNGRFIAGGDVNFSSAGGEFHAYPFDGSLSVVSYAIAGSVFEDVDFGGGAGRSRAAASGVVRGGVRVELYAASGSFLDSTSTDGSGAYAFDGLAAASYHVRVVNATVTSSRTGSDGTERAVQTFRTNASSGSAVAVTTEVGGVAPALTDAGANTTGATLASLATATTAAQSVASVTLVSADLSGVDFGFNFDVIVNTNDHGQGSFRQFLVNAERLGGDGSLAQAGRTAGIETTIFQIPTSDPRHDLDGDGEFRIRPDSQFETIDSPVVIDGRTQTATIGNTNAAGPEIVLDGAGAGASASGLRFNAAASGSAIHALVIGGFTSHGVTVAAGTSGMTVQGSWIGLAADGVTANGNGGSGILTSGSAGVIGGTLAGAANVIAYNTGAGVLVRTVGGNAILGNRVVGNGTIGIDLEGDGVTPNDSLDADGLANDRLNYPVLAAATVSGVTTTIAFSLDVPAGTYRIEFFTNPSGGDGTGYGEGEVLAGTTSVVHAGAGAQTYLATVPGAAGDVWTATTTVALGGGLFGSTSEFSFARTAVAASYAVLVGADGADTLRLLPSNGVATAYRFSVRNDGNAPDAFDLFGASGGTIGIDSITGPAVTRSGAIADSARVASLGAGVADSAFVWLTVPDVAAATVDAISLRARSVSLPAATDSGWVHLLVVRPAVVLSKAVSPSGPTAPGADLTYTLTVTNVGSAAAATVAVLDALPSELDFKIGSPAESLPGGVTAVLQFSADGGATWTYTPASGACGAPAGYDRCVNRLRWQLQQPFANSSPGDVATFTFVARVR